MIEQGKQRRARFTAYGFGNFQIAPRGRVQFDELRMMLNAQTEQLRQSAALRSAHVFQQSPSRTHAQMACIDSKANQIVHIEMARQIAFCRFAVELPRRDAAHGDRAVFQQCEFGVFRRENFSRAQALQLRIQPVGIGFHQGKVTRGEREPRQPQTPFLESQRHQAVFAFVVKQGCVGQRAGRHHAHHFALDRPLGVDFADLLANRHRFTQAHQSRQILLGCVVGNTGHADRDAGRLAARGQRDVEQFRGAHGIVVKQLVEVAHAIKNEFVRMIRFQAQVLLHHRRVF